MEDLDGEQAHRWEGYFLTRARKRTRSDQSCEEKFLAFESVFAKISLDCSYEEAMQLILSPKAKRQGSFAANFHDLPFHDDSVFSAQVP